MNTKIVSGNEAKEILLRGVNKLGNAVGDTLGSKGRNVLIGANSTKDGVSVSVAINPKDKFEEAVVNALKQAAVKAVNLSGDGTSGSTVLAQSMINTSIEHIKNGANPIDLRRGIELAVERTVEKIKEVAVPVKGDIKKLRDVATTSANNDPELGELISEAISKVKNDGLVNVRPSPFEETYIDMRKGMEYEQGVISPMMINNAKKRTTELDDVLILLTDADITSYRDIERAFGIAMNDLKQPLFIICGSMEGEAKATFIQTFVKGKAPIMATRAWGMGSLRADFLEDLAIYTGGNVISTSLGNSLNDVTAADFGRAKTISVGLNSTTIMDGAGKEDAIAERIEDLKVQLEEESEQGNQNILKTRIAKLSGGFALLMAGGYTELERQEKLDRIDDSLKATRSAIEEGIVEGGGLTLYKIADSLKEDSEIEDINLGISVVKSALKQPLRRMVKNAGKDVTEIEKGIAKRDGQGYNLETNEYEHLLNTGIVDAAKVIRVALESAGSVSGVMITTESIIVEDAD